MTMVPFEILSSPEEYEREERREALETLTHAEGMITRYAGNLLAAMELLDRNHIKHRLDSEMVGQETVDVLVGLHALKTLYSND